MTIKQSARGERRRPGLEIAIVLLLFLLTAVGAWGYLTASGTTPGPMHGDSMLEILSAVRWAAGYGFSEPIPFPLSLIYTPAFADLCVGKLDFITQKGDAFPPNEMPHHLLLPFEGDPKFIYDRIYLLYAIGLLWRVTGISWSALNFLAAFFAGLTAAIGYGVCRLGMRRPVAVLTTLCFASSPLFLTEIPALRDLAKAPFILAAVLVIGYLLAHAPKKRMLLIAAALIGLFLGFGMGFRQDIIIAPPPLLFALLFAPGARRLALRVRLASILLFLVCFLIPAYPVFRMVGETGGNNSFHLMQGLAQPMFADVDTARASYGPFYTDDDYLVHATITQYDLQTRHDRYEVRDTLRLLLTRLSIRELPVNPELALVLAGISNYCRSDLDIWSSPSEEVTRRLVRDVALTLPADIVTRWYGATLRCIRGLQGKNFFWDVSNPILQHMMDWHGPFIRHFRSYGLAYAGIVFLILAGQDLFLGIGAALLLLYFCGYTSIQFQLRHAFHLDLVSYWLAGFLLNLLLVTCFGKWKDLLGAPRRFFAPMCAALGRAAAASLILMLILLLPLYSARLVQRFQTNKLLKQYESAVLEPVAATRTEQPGGRVLYSPVSLPDLERSPDSPEILGAYLVLELEQGEQIPSAGIEYTRTEFEWDKTDDPPVWGTDNPGRLRYFFPVFDFSKGFQDRTSYGSPLPRFVGVSVPQGVTVKGLYRVRNKEQLPIMMNMWLPTNSRLFKDHCTLF